MIIRLYLHTGHRHYRSPL